MIEEHDIVVLTRDLPDEHLVAGDTGTVVLMHRGGKAYEVEFTTLEGDTLAVVTVEAAGVRPAGEREIAHARAVA
jgi:hypothetical protein